MKKFILAALLVLAIIQLAVPGKMIWDREKILRSGKSVKFQTAPFDPLDPFRGKYIYLSFKENSYSVPLSSKLQTGEEIYVLLKLSPDGFARISGLSSKKPNKGLFVQSKIEYVSEEEKEKLVRLDYPFNRYYLEEGLAPKAEEVYRERNVDSSQKSFAIVNILDGRAVLKDVVINDSSIVKVIKARRNQ